VVIGLFMIAGVQSEEHFTGHELILQEEDGVDGERVSLPGCSDFEGVMGQYPNPQGRVTSGARLARYDWI
jgi:hypothetical protein